MNNTQPSSVAFFILQGLGSLGEKRMVLFVIFLLAYTIILGGNSMIIYLVLYTLHSHLHEITLGSPMYFFLHHLSFVDMVYTTVTIPNMLSGFLTDLKTVSFPGCFLQMYCFIHMATTGRALLTVMAYDRYVAICNPLRYTTVMTRPVRLLLIVGAWTFGAFFTLPAITMATQRSYCGPNVVRHCWCDPSSLRVLVCGDTQVENMVSLSSAVISLLTTGLLILISYILIVMAIAKMGTTQRLKAFTTCVAHLTVVNIVPLCALYIIVVLLLQVRIIVSVLYSVLTPFLNPMIYSLRNKELRDAIKRAFFKVLSNC
uniref:G-protein coupled receptors family 1 profile domain-containing protein n=1 Tax=Esox lucius TaxID=8010 RepID=A0A6Q2YTC1_ESOLU